MDDQSLSKIAYFVLNLKNQNNLLAWQGHDITNNTIERMESVLEPQSPLIIYNIVGYTSIPNKLTIPILSNNYNKNNE